MIIISAVTIAPAIGMRIETGNNTSNTIRLIRLRFDVARVPDRGRCSHFCGRKMRRIEETDKTF